MVVSGLVIQLREIKEKKIKRKKEGKEDEKRGRKKEMK
jgi:hypothetical protein